MPNRNARWNVPDWTEFPPPFDRYVRQAYKTGDLVMIRNAIGDARRLTKQTGRSNGSVPGNRPGRSPGTITVPKHTANVIVLDAHRRDDKSG